MYEDSVREEYSRATTLAFTKAGRGHYPRKRLKTMF